MKINTEVIHVLELADKGSKTIIITKLKDIKESMFIMNEKQEESAGNQKV